MSNARRQTYTFRDARGQTARVTMYILNTGALTAAQLQTNAGNISNDIIAMTNAAYAGGTGPDTDAAAAVAYGTNAAYPTVEDKAVLSFASAVGGIHRYSIPAPKSAIFLADGETVDSANALVKQFVADMLNATYSGTAVSAGQTAGASSRDAIALATYLGGQRARRKTQRKNTIYTLNPALSGPGE